MKPICFSLLILLLLVLPCRGDDSASGHYKAGIDAWNAGKVDTAISEWKTVLRLKPDSPATKDRLLEALSKKVEQLEAQLDVLRITNDSLTKKLIDASAEKLAAVSSAPGTVEGTITYHDTRMNADRPDVGTQIWLVKDTGFAVQPGRELLKRDKHLWLLSKSATDRLYTEAGQYAEEALQTGSVSGVLEMKARAEALAREDPGATRYEIVQETICDGGGNYEMKGIPPGEYTLVVVTSSSALKTKYWKAVTVQPGQVVDVSNLVELQSTMMP